MNRTKADNERFEKLVQIGCVACIFLGYGPSPAAIHHIRRHGGKRDHQKTIPLCAKHHQTGGKGVAVHSGRKAFTEAITSEERLLEITNELIGE